MLALVLLTLSLGGCITVPRTPFAPAEMQAAEPPGFHGVRYNQEDGALAAMLRRLAVPDASGRIEVLAISGGGANGAYGAGLLNGWTQAGSRPTFQVVTGVSSGALAAPFAFLGPAWDPQLREAYTGAQAAKTLRNRMIGGLLTPGFYSATPLRNMVHRYITDAFLRAIAVEHAKGRRLLVATTNLDTEKLVVWDMGAIASHGGPEARALFEDILIASASVPGVFPPVMIHVQDGDHGFEEMHVDGQVDSGFFAIPQALMISDTAIQPRRDVRLYIIVNGWLRSPTVETARNTGSILERALDAAMKSSMRSLVVGSLEFCKREACTLVLASLPQTVKDDPLDFKAAHLDAAYGAGRDAILQGTAWRTRLSTDPDLLTPPANLKSTKQR